MALGKLDIIIAADTAQIRKDMGTAVGIMQSGAKQMESVAKTAAAAVAGYFTFDYFKENVKHTLEYADSLSKLSQKVGASANQLYSLDAAAKLSDVSFESLQNSLKKFNKNIGDASQGTGDALIAFKNLGIQFKNNDGTIKSSFEIMEEVSDKFKDMPDGVTKTTTAMQLFGKSGADMIPMLNEGRDALEQYLGIMDAETGKAAERFNDSFRKMHFAMDAVYMKTLKDLTPTINALSGSIEGLASESLKSSDSLASTLSNGIDKVVESFYTVSILAKDTTSDMGDLIGSTIDLTVSLYDNVHKMVEAFTFASSDNGGLGLFKESLLGLKVTLDTIYVGLHNTITILTKFSSSFGNIWDIAGKNNVNLEVLKKEFYNVFSEKDILTIDDLTDKYVKSYKLLTQSQKDFSKAKQDIATNEKSASSSGSPSLPDYSAQLAQINAQIQGLSKQYDIKKQIAALDIESQLRNMKITQPYADYLNAENDILSSIAKNESEIALLRKKSESETNSSGRVTDLQKVNELQSENELLQRKRIANQEKFNQVVSLTNSQLMDSIRAVDMSDTDKKYQDLAKNVQDLINKGADLALVGEYATKIADQIARDDAYSHLQTELDVKKQYIEVSLYGSQKESALEDVRHEEVMANLQKELDTKKINDSEYRKLMELENQLHRQNSDSFYKFMLTAFDNIEKAMDSNFFDAMTGKFKSFGDWLKDFFANIGNSIAQGLSRTLAGSLMDSLKGSLTSSYTTGLSALAVGSTVSASEVSAIMNSGGVFDSATNSIKTSGGSIIKLGTDGSGTISSSGSDVLGLANTISSLKTAYGVLSGGISSSILTGFQSVSGLLAQAGFNSAATGLMSFGAGFANPFAYAGMSGLPTAMTVGSLASAGLLGGTVGYGTGWLGDKLFGANTYAGTTGALGGATGGILASLGVVGGPLGIIGGSLLGSLLGGLFGKKKTTDTGIQFFQNIDALDTLSTETVKAYADWKKKGWFSSSEGTNYTDLTSTQMKQIEAVFDTYDYLLTQLGDTDRISLAAGKYSKETFQDALAKNFIKAFTDIDQNTDSTIYDLWVDYAKSVDKTVIQALSDSINSYVTEKRTFSIWALGDSVDALALKAQYAQEDFDNLANMIGASGVTVENYLQKYDEAIKNSFDETTITNWKNLGDALMSATDAASAYTSALQAQAQTTTNNVLSSLQAQLTQWVSALGSIQSAIDAISPTYKTLDELKNATISLDNYSTLLSQLEATRQNEINTLTTAANARIEQLNNEKTLFNSLSQYIDELNLKLLGSNITSDYFFNELAKAKATFTQGGIVDTSKLTASASTYLDSALQHSTSQLEYFREVAKVKDGLNGLGSMVTGGSLEGIQSAIVQEEQTLAQKLDELNQTALSILNGWKGTATSNVSSLTKQIATVNSVDPLITAAYANILGRTPEDTGAKYWQSTLNNGLLNATSITDTIAKAAVQELYVTTLGRYGSDAEVAQWQSAIDNGSISAYNIDEAFKQAAQTELSLRGFSSGGYTGDGGINDIAGVVHGKEFVVDAPTTDALGFNGSGGVFQEMANEIKQQKEEIQYLREINLKTASEVTRLSKLIDRLSPDGDALQVRITA